MGHLYRRLGEKYRSWPDLKYQMNSSLPSPEVWHVDSNCQPWKDLVREARNSWEPEDGETSKKIDFSEEGDPVCPQCRPPDD